MDNQKQNKDITDQDSPQTLVTNSSSITGYSYDAQGLALTMYYKTGSVYEFHNVNPGIVSSIFDVSGSVGSKASKLLKGLKYKKL